MEIVTNKNLKGINQVFKRLNTIRRWTSLITEGKYSELSKQALNCVVCFVLATEAEAKGETINWDRFPQIALYRAFQKAYVNYDTPEHILSEICELGYVQFEQAFGKATNDLICELTNEEFARFLSEGIGTKEEMIYKAATKIATFVELKELKLAMNGEYEKKFEEVMRSLYKYKSIPSFNELSDTEGRYFELFSTISKLRNQNRWAAYSYSLDCPVLGHLFDTAVFAYLMALEKGETERTATKCFFMGIFHDIPEAFTKDIPSPIKDRIPGFRSLTEQYELQMMEEHVYPLVSPRVAQALKSVMFEEDENSSFKAMMKGADYMSAVSEIWRQLKAGTRDEAFVLAIQGHEEKFRNGTAEISATAEKLYKEILQYAEGLQL